MLAFLPVVREGLAPRTGDAPSLAAGALGALARIVPAAVAAALLVALAETIWEGARWRRRLRMDHDELRRELRQTEGDPHVRGRRRRTHHALIRGSLGRLGDAAFVIANPTHVAVALEYAPPAVPVPRVLVRAVDAGARLLKRRARALGIPVVEDPVLARLLFGCTQSGAYIPRSAYDAVARIVAALLHRGALRR